MNLLLWILLGLIVGWVGSIATRSNYRQEPFMDIVVGIIGALIGGLVMNLLGLSLVTGFDVVSLFIAAGGAISLIAIRHALVD